MGQFLNYLSFRWEHLLALAGAHVVVVLVAVAIATAIAVTTGFMTYRTRRPAGEALTIANNFITIPSFALFGLFLSILSLGFPPTVVALVMLALLPILC